MSYYLKNCRTGEDAVYETKVDITEKDGVVRFTFTAHNSQGFCRGSKHNDYHCMGDACEVLIGSDPERKWYYEIEVSPVGKLLVAKMGYMGANEWGDPELDIHFVSEEDNFVKSGAEKIEDGYVAWVEFEKKDIMVGEGEVYFNAYRLDTDGGEIHEKHLFALYPTLCSKFHVPKCYQILKDYANK